ncbi:MAG: hypothetical protein JWM80_4703 [Cyanobacteria bacterium RYN_339]|nr:hypothetical protein [Cyanobacteria bacterium RYN_339]
MSDHEILNQDGSVLGGGGGGAVANPTGLPAQRELPIGDANPTLRELGQHREEIPGISGGASAGDKGVSGWIDADPSGIGDEVEEIADENMEL